MYTFSHPSPLPPDPATGAAGSPLPSRTAAVTVGSPLPPDLALITRAPAPAMSHAGAGDGKTAVPSHPAERSR
jgi:hypothetical protein